MDGSSRNMIAVNELTKAFAGESVLGGVSFEIQGGSIFALVGPSGAGKSTILNIIAGITPANGGSVRLASGHRLGYMLQEPALLPWRTLLENARLGLELADGSATTEDLEYLFREFDLSGSQNKYPSECSLGMQQRTAIIRTLSTLPTALLLDEPFSALDYDIKLRAQLKLAQYVEETHAAVLLVTHDIDDAIALSNQVMILSAKPATVKATIQIDLGLARRDPISARTSPRFQRYFEEILHHLKYLPSR